MLHCFRALGVNIALDVLSGAVHVLDDMAFEALTDLEAGRDPRKALLAKYSPEDVDELLSEIEALRAQGVRFAFIKATEGSSHVDERFAQNAGEALAAGVPAGAYHFFSFESPGQTQAENLLSALEGREFALPCAVDFEFYGAFFENPPDLEDTRAELRAMLEAVEAETGRKPLLYATWRSYRMYLMGAFDDYPLWIRDVYLWPGLTLPNRDWTFWQYSDKGTLAGYTGEEEHIDLNVFNGGEAEFAALLQA